jgi:hypothetical protein
MWHGQDQSEMNFGGISKEAIRRQRIVKTLIIRLLVGVVSMGIAACAAVLLRAFASGLRLTLGLRRS